MNGLVVTAATFATVGESRSSWAKLEFGNRKFDQKRAVVRRAPTVVFPYGPSYEECPLNPSLTVVVPAFNVQAPLSARMEELLEVVPELTSRFEVIVVDDASTDATVEAAQELSLRFPQVQLLLQPMRVGPQEALRSALRYSHGEWLYVCPMRDDFDLHELRKLWDRRTAEGAVYANIGSRSPAKSGTAPLLRTSAAAETGIPDLLLVPRRLLAMWSLQGERMPVCPYLRSRGFSLTELELRQRTRAIPAGRKPAATGSAVRGVPTPLGVTPPATTSSAARRPSFLSRLATFGRSE